jgi:predicted methyltransferase
MMKTIWTSVAVAMTIAVGAPTAQAQKVSPAVTSALADPARADQQGDDARRKAADVLAFSGVRPGNVVVDYLPGAGYWTRIFTGVVGPKGHVYAVWPAAGAKYAEKTLPALQARNLANVTAVVQTTNLPTSPKPVDLFWTVQNYHDIANNGGGEGALKAFDKAVFNMLKRGGLGGTETRHRIDPAVVKAQVQAAGFKFVGESTALRNPADDHTKPVFDPAIRGTTDQFVYKFKKP